MADLKKQLASADDVVRQLRLGRADLEEALAHQKAAAEEVWRFSHGFPLFSQHFPWFSYVFLIVSREIWLFFRSQGLNPLGLYGPGAARG